MSIVSNWSVNHHFCAVINPYPITQIRKYLHFPRTAITGAPPPKSQKPQGLPGKKPTHHSPQDSKRKRTRTPKPQKSSPPLNDTQPTRIQHTAEEQHQLSNPAHAVYQHTLNTNNNDEEQEELMTNIWY